MHMHVSCLEGNVSRLLDGCKHGRVKVVVGLPLKLLQHKVVDAIAMDSCRIVERTACASNNVMSTTHHILLYNMNIRTD